MDELEEITPAVYDVMYSLNAGSMKVSGGLFARESIRKKTPNTTIPVAISPMATAFKDILCIRRRDFKGRSKKLEGALVSNEDKLHGCMNDRVICFLAYIHQQKKPLFERPFFILGAN
jgi:hypothetical protein